MIYIIDNDKAYELNRLYFVESPAAVMEPLIELMQKAWRRTCYGCGKAREEAAGPACPGLPPINADRPHSRAHEYRDNPFLCGTAPVIHWLALGSRDSQKNLNPAQWIAEIVDSLRDEVADLAAAREFIRLGTAINPEIWWAKFDLAENK